MDTEIRCFMRPEVPSGLARSAGVRRRLRAAPDRAVDAAASLAGTASAAAVKDEGDRQTPSVPANILDRQFEAERPNQKWIADFTYIWTGEGWLYVAAVIDLFSRRVVGWSMSASMTAQLVADALLMAVWRVASRTRCCITPIGAAGADSTGRCNTSCMPHSEEFRRGFPPVFSSRGFFGA